MTLLSLFIFIVVLFLLYQLYQLYRNEGAFKTFHFCVIALLPWILLPIVKYIENRNMFFNGDLSDIGTLFCAMISLFVLFNINNHKDKILKCHGSAWKNGVWAALKIQWWQLLFVPGFITFSYYYLLRHFVVFEGTNDAHHYFSPMLMIEYGDLRYSHFVNTDLVKPGTSKYVTAFFGYCYFLLSKFFLGTNSMDPPPYIQAYFFLRSLVAFFFVSLAWPVYLLVKKIFSEYDDKTGAIFVALLTTSFFYLQEDALFVRDDIMNVTVGLLGLWYLLDWDDSGDRKSFWMCSILLAYTFAYKVYTGIFLLSIAAFILTFHKLDKRGPWRETERRSVVIAILKRNMLFFSTVSFIFILGILQLFIDPEIGRYALYSLKIFSHKTNHPGVLVAYDHILKLGFFDFIKGHLVIFYGVFKYWGIPFGIIVVLLSSCWSFYKKNKIVPIILVSIAIHLILLRWVITSYGAAHYVTFDLILVYCLIGGAVAAIGHHIKKRSYTSYRIYFLTVFVLSIVLWLYNGRGIHKQLISFMAQRKSSSVNGVEKNWYRYSLNQVCDSISAAKKIEMEGISVYPLEKSACSRGDTIRINDVSKINAHYLSFKSFFNQSTEYDAYYNRLENIYLSPIPPKLDYDINNEGIYVSRTTKKEIVWDNYELFTFVKNPLSRSKVRLSYMITHKIQGQVDIELTTRWSETRRHIHRQVYHLYNNGGKMWDSMSTEFQITDDQIGRVQTITVPFGEVMKGYPHLADEIEIRLSVKTKKRKERSLGKEDLLYVSDVQII